MSAVNLITDTASEAFSIPKIEAKVAFVFAYLPSATRPIAAVAEPDGHAAALRAGVTVIGTRLVDQLLVPVAAAAEVGSNMRIAYDRRA